MVRPGDGASVNEAVLETLAELQPWMPWPIRLPASSNPKSMPAGLTASLLSARHFPLRLVEKTSGLYVGAAGLHVRGWQVPRFEIGYWCRKRFQGQGFITEAVAAILQFGFQILKARRIEIRCDSRNLRSSASPSGSACDAKRN